MRGFVIVAMVSLALGCSSEPDVVHPDAAPPATDPVCGDGICVSSELTSCAVDCGAPPAAACGNGSCEAGESAATCPGDCGGGGGQVCGNGTCEAGETEATCPGDCATSGGGGSATCGDLVCDAGESSLTCPTDCGAASTCPGGDDVGCFFCWFDPTQCIPPQTEALCGECLGLGP